MFNEFYVKPFQLLNFKMKYKYKNKANGDGALN